MPLPGGSWRFTALAIGTEYCVKTTIRKNYAEFALYPEVNPFSIVSTLRAPGELWGNHSPLLNRIADDYLQFSTVSALRAPVELWSIRDLCSSRTQMTICSSRHCPLFELSPASALRVQSWPLPTVGQLALRARSWPMPTAGPLEFLIGSAEKHCPALQGPIPLNRTLV